MEPPLGQLAIDAGHITPAQRDDVLRFQAELKKNDIFMRTGEILARKALLQPAQVRDLLQKQGVSLVRCATCGKQFNARNWSPGKGACNCGSPLESAPPESPLSVMGNAAMTRAGDSAPGKPAPPPGSLRGQYFGKYPLLEELGRGAMGVVYKAWDPALSRVVAIKVLVEGDDPRRRHQFAQEARSAAKLRHPGIVSVHEVSQADGRGYFTMDFIDGAPLSVLIKDDTAGQPLAFEGSETPLRHTIEWVRDVAVALQHAHESGLLHCDVKPGNILIDRRNRALISDFSAARSLRQDTTDPTRRVLGTLFYMSPEQAMGRPDDVGPHSDVWAAGVVLYLLLTGTRPFSGDSPRDVRRNIATQPATAPRSLNPRIPRPLEAIVCQCLQKAPRLRYPSAKALAEDLQRYLDGSPVQAPMVEEAPRAAPAWQDRRAWVAAALVAVVIGGVVFVKWVMNRASKRVPYPTEVEEGPK